MSGIDWTTQDGCQRCDEHGPFLPGGEAARDLHQAGHGLIAAFFAATHIPQFADWLDRRLTR